MLSIANQISKKISAWHLELIQEIIKCGVLIGTGIPRFIPVNAHTMACSKQKNSVWFLSFPVMNFIPENTHYQKNQGSILIKICGKQEGVFRQFERFAATRSWRFSPSRYTIGIDAENQTLINHKCVFGALNRHFC